MALPLRSPFLSTVLHIRNCRVGAFVLRIYPVASSPFGASLLQYSMRYTNVSVIQSTLLIRGFLNTVFSALFIISFRFFNRATVYDYY